MKILLVTPYFSPKIGGLENYALTVAKGLKAKGHEIVVVTSNSTVRAQTESTHEGLRIIGLPVAITLSNTPFNPLWYFYLRRIIRQENPDIINAHTPVPGMADVAFLARGQTKFAATYHAGSMKKGSGIIDVFLGCYEHTFLKYLLKRSDEIICVYPAFLRKLLGPHVTPAFIPPGVDTKLFRPSTQKNPKTASILFVGRIEHSSSWKGIESLLNALKLVVASRPETTLRLVGSGDAVEYYQQLVRQLGLVKHVTFSGTLKGVKLVDAYQSAEVLVLPSESDAESFGIVLIEAMACGIPVIGSNIGGIPNVIRDNENGLLVTPKSPADLAVTINKILTQPDLAHKLAANGEDYVRRYYSAKTLINTTEEQFEKVVKPRVVHVVANYPPHLGGMEKVVQLLATAQHDMKTRLMVITSNQGAKHSQPDDKVPVVRLRSFILANTPIMPALIFKLLKIRKSDVIHLHVAQAFTPETVWLASKIKRFRYIAQIHIDVGPSSFFGFLLAAYKSIVLKRVLRSAQFVTAFDDDQKQSAIAKYGLSPNRVKIVPNGVENKFYSEPHKLHRKPRLLFVGRISVQKNLQQLLRSLNGISGKVETSIVGGGDLQPAMQNLSAELKLKNVTFHGRLDGDALLQQYVRSDMFVLPSEREGMPLVLLEAMAASLPVIGTDVAGISNLVNDSNGVLIDLHDHEAMQEAIRSLTSNTEAYARKSRGAYETAHDYDWSQVVTHFNSLYTGEP